AGDQQQDGEGERESCDGVQLVGAGARKSGHGPGQGGRLPEIDRLRDAFGAERQGDLAAEPGGRVRGVQHLLHHTPGLAVGDRRLLAVPPARCQLLSTVPTALFSKSMIVTASSSPWVRAWCTCVAICE